MIKFDPTPRLEDLEEVEPAFEGSVTLSELDPERRDELRPFIDRVVLLDLGERPPNKGENNPRFLFEVYLLDAHGVSHTVEVFDDPDAAVHVARDLSTSFEVPLDDPAHVTAGR
jgi:hypothetical protein